MWVSKVNVYYVCETTSIIKVMQRPNVSNYGVIQAESPNVRECTIILKGLHHWKVIKDKDHDKHCHDDVHVAATYDYYYFCTPDCWPSVMGGGSLWLSLWHCSQVTWPHPPNWTTLEKWLKASMPQFPFYKMGQVNVFAL